MNIDSVRYVQQTSTLDASEAAIVADMAQAVRRELLKYWLAKQTARGGKLLEAAFTKARIRWWTRAKQAGELDASARALCDKMLGMLARGERLLLAKPEVKLIAVVRGAMTNLGEPDIYAEAS